MSNEITLADICQQATEAGAYISDKAAFEGVVRNAQPGQGDKPSKATLSDPKNPAITVNAARYGGSFVGLEGSVIRCVGKSIKAKLYKGKVDLTLGDKATITVVGTAPAAAAAPQSAPQGDSNRPPAQQPVGDPEAHFHKEMGKSALLWLHSFQYMRDVSAKIDSPALSPDLFQAGVSSLFIEGNRRGLGNKVPKLREADKESGGYVRFVPVKPAGPTPEQIEAEAKARAAAAAAEEERRHKEEMAQRAKANDDEDVPF